MSEKKKSKKELEEKVSEQEVTEAPAEETVEEEPVLSEAEQLAAENKELQDKLLRQMAEFDNFRKRTAKEKSDLYTDATARCVVQILGVVDNFERAFEAAGDDDTEFRKGMQMIFDQLMQILAGMGVQEIDALGKPFDPELHNAVSQAQDENYEDNTVCQVFQKGFTLNGKVVRHAMVVVANS